MESISESKSMEMNKLVGAFLNLFQEAIDLKVDEKIKQTVEENTKDDEWISEKEALELLRVSKPTLYRYRNLDRFEYSKLESKKILYNKHSILKFIKSNSNSAYVQ